MTIDVNVEIDNKEVTDYINRLNAATSNMAPAFNAIGERVASLVDLTFRDTVDPYGKAWPLLSIHSTLIKEDSSGNLSRTGTKPLNDTGNLKGSITKNVILNGNGVEVGTDVPYAPTHQFGANQGQYGTNSRGGPIPWGDVPARMFLPTEGLPPSWSDDVLDIINKYLDV